MLSVPSAYGLTEISGKSAGAFYRIAVPDNWNGKLVVWGRGLNLDPLPENPDLGPLADLQLSQGYAVAASSYSQIGWSLFRTAWDYRSLLRIFRKKFGRPDEVILTGGSLGGLVAVQGAELLSRQNITGVYSLCGPLAGSRNWDTGLDLRLTYDAVCADVPGAYIPGAEFGLPKNSTLTEIEIAAAANQCTGILAPPHQRTPEQSARLSSILEEITVPEDFFLILMDFATRVQADLVHDRNKLHGNIGTGNTFVTYDSPEIDALIRRVEPRFFDALNLFFNYTPLGITGDAKIVSLHTDQDGLVFVENQTEFRNKVASDQLTIGIVAEEQPSHCGFTEAEAVAGWEELRNWLESDVQPDVVGMQSTCQLLASSGLAQGPCRFDPSFELLPYSTRTPQRYPH